VERDRFIRPNYWEGPLVDPPEDLRHIQFVYVPLTVPAK